MIFYESPHRLIKTLGQFAEFMGADRKVSVSRELTKKFEETVNGTLEEVIGYFEAKTIKGEFVLILEGKSK
jgi:16S rRNA (cytidine1402-2'-O)-methyltransferase